MRSARRQTCRSSTATRSSSSRASPAATSSTSTSPSAPPPLAPVTPQTEVDAKVLLQRIDEAAKQGYAIVQNQTVVGDISVAAAITDHGGGPIGAINVSVPSTRWSVQRAHEQLLPHVLLAATSISQAKGGSG